MRLNFDASSVLHPSSARSKTRSSRKTRTSENQFSEVFYSEFSVLLYTQNRKLGVESLGVFSKVYPNNDFFLLNCVTSRFLIKLRGLGFALYPKTKTRRWKTSEFHVIITVLSAVQNGKLRVGKPRSLIKVPQSMIKIPQRKSPRFSSPSSRFWLWCKMENSEEKTSEKYCLRFPRFLRTLSFRPHHPSSVLSGSSFLPFSACLIAKFGSWLMTYSIAREANEFNMSRNITLSQVRIC